MIFKPACVVKTPLSDHRKEKKIPPWIDPEPTKQQMNEQTTAYREKTKAKNKKKL